MILTCPNCASRFLLSAQVLAPEGRRVKCSNCMTDWFQEPDPDELIDNIENEIEDIPEAVKPLPEGSSVPALTEEPEEEGSDAQAKIAGYVAALGIFVVILSVLVFMKPQIMRAWPPIAGFYQVIGMDVGVPGAGLVFDRVEARLASNGEILIKGQVINLTAHTQNVPLIEASLRDGAGSVIGLWPIRLDVNALEAESSATFKIQYEGETQNADHVKLRFVLASKIASTGGGNNPVPHEDDHVDPHDDEAH